MKRSRMPPEARKIHVLAKSNVSGVSLVMLSALLADLFTLGSGQHEEHKRIASPFHLDSKFR
jgi:hypothetical protein